MLLEPISWDEDELIDAALKPKRSNKSIKHDEPELNYKPPAQEQVKAMDILEDPGLLFCLVVRKLKGGSSNMSLKK